MRLTIAVAFLALASLPLAAGARASVFVGEVLSGYQSASDGYENFSDAGIYVVRTPHPAQLLATGTRPKLLPDRRTVAYCKGAALMVQPVSGGTARQIGGGPAYDDPDLNCSIAFDWAPGGSALVTTEPSAVPHCFQPGVPGSYAWPQISLAGMDATDRVLVSVGDGPVLRAGVLAYVAPVPCGGPGPWLDAAFVAAADGSNPHQLAIAPSASMNLALSADGRHLAVLDAAGTITLVRTTGRPRAVRVGRGSDPAWSPNGRRLAYLDRHERLVVIDAATRRVIHRLRGPVGQIVWSADGSRILFTRPEDVAGALPYARYYSVYTVDTRSWRVRRVARAGFLTTFASDNDGSWVDVDWR